MRAAQSRQERPEGTSGVRTPGKPDEAADGARGASESASQSETPSRRPSQVASCRCGSTWTALAAAHCSGCHRTFVGSNLFDAHRSAVGEHGQCRNPEELTIQSGPRKGYRLAFYRDGMWRGPEMSEDEKRTRFGGSGS